MKAAILSAPGRISVEDVPDARIVDATDAVVEVLLAGVCGTDLHAYRGEPGPLSGPRCGHEFVGRVVETGPAVDRRRIASGMIVVAPFMFADGTCTSCRRGLPSSCRSGAMWGNDHDGGQGEAVRVPFAAGTLVPLPVEGDDERLTAVLALADVMPSGYHATRHVGPGMNVVVVGDGSVGLCAALAAVRAGAGRVWLLSRHPDRARVGARFGAEVLMPGDGVEDVVVGATDGAGADVVVDAVGSPEAISTAFRLCADGGTVTTVGGPQPMPDPSPVFLRNITVGGGLAPARTYLPQLLDEVLAGRLDPSPVFDRTVDLCDVASAYELMDHRRAIKVALRVAR